ncbi:MAG: hypothetical protein ACI9FR_001181 [Cryomorphaceae bacterium]|jgi:hypothetical protein
MNAVNKAIARFSMLCYLVAASIAAAHAFPMPSAAASNIAAAGKSATMVMDIASSDSQALNLDQTLDVTAHIGEIQPDCHQSNKGSSSASSMSLCKIFCSATGHALTTDFLVDLASIAPPIHSVSLSDDLRTRQLSVEQHPPK